MSVICTGGAASRCYQAGAQYGNPEIIQVHPTAIPGEDKCRLISESARGEGGRVWVPRKPGDTRPPNRFPKSERYYFLEETYPKYGNIVPRDIATREIFQVCQEGLGVGGGNMVYLDLRDKVKQHRPRRILHKLEGILEIYEKFVGADPLDEPMKIFPAVHYSMGGLWTTFTQGREAGGLEFGDPTNMMTNIPGLYAMGEVSFALPRGEPAGGELAAVLHLRRAVRRDVHQELHHRRARRRRRRTCRSRCIDAVVKPGDG